MTAPQDAPEPPSSGASFNGRLGEKFMSFEESSERIKLLIDAMAKAKDLGDAILLAERAGLELDVVIEMTQTARGETMRQFVVSAKKRLTLLSS